MVGVKGKSPLDSTTAPHGPCPILGQRFRVGGVEVFRAPGGGDAQAGGSGGQIVNVVSVGFCPPLFRPSPSVPRVPTRTGHNRHVPGTDGGSEVDGDVRPKWALPKMDLRTKRLLVVWCPVGACSETGEQVAVAVLFAVCCYCACPVALALLLAVFV